MFRFHPHLHYLVPGGGLRLDGRTWVAARKNYLVSVHALGAHYRTLFQEQLKKGQPELFAQVPAPVWQRGWVVDSRAAGSGKPRSRTIWAARDRLTPSRRAISATPITSSLPMRAHPRAT